MCATADEPSSPVHDLMIVPWPQRDAWAVVDRRGDVLAIGAYLDCLRHLTCTTAAPRAA